MTGLHRDLPDSELHEAKGAAAADLGHVLTSLGDGTSTFQEILNAPPASFARTITVAGLNADFTTVAAGVAAATVAVPPASAGSPIVIRVFPGKYVESPFVVPAFVSVVGVAHDTVFLETDTPGSVFITMSDGASLIELSIQGATGPGGVAISVAGVRSDFTTIDVRDCTTGMKFSGTGTDVRVLHSRFVRELITDTLTTAVVVENGASVAFASCLFEGAVGARLGTGIEVRGPGSIVNVNALLARHCDVCFFAHSDGHLNALASHVSSNDIVFQADSGSATHAVGVDIEDSLTYDIQVLSADVEFRFFGIAEHEKLSIDPGANVQLLYLSATLGDFSTKSHSELHVGNELNPKESAFGGGDSHVRGMIVQTNTNMEGGDWADITSQINTANGASVDIFPGAIVGSSVYIGGNLAFPGVKIIVTTAMVGGAILAEYWDGAAWASFDLMAAQAESPHDQFGDLTLLRPEDEQTRFDIGELNPNWEQKSLNGQTKYWVRYRVVTAITTIPRSEQIKLGTHRTEINSDGTIERFGSSEQRRLLQFSLENSSPLAGSSPGSTAIDVADGITLNLSNNVFRNNSVDGLGAAISVPRGLDTSRELTLVVVWRPSDNSAGAVELEVGAGTLQPGDNTNGTSPRTDSSTVVALSGQQGELIVTEISFRIPTATSASLLALRFLRDGTAGNLDDTYSGNAELMSFRLEGFFWK